jgi:hypothetical protein
MELILPFTYTVTQGTEAEYTTYSLCKNKPPFAIYAKAVGDKTANPDAAALKTLAMIYDLVLITPKEHLVFS